MKKETKDTIFNIIFSTIIFILYTVIIITTNSEVDIANTGANVIGILWIVAAFFGVRYSINKTKDSDYKIVKYGIPVVVFLAITITFGTLMTNFRVALLVGGISFYAFWVVIYLLNK